MSCFGDSDDCTGEATTTRDTSSGYLLPTPYCAACAAAYDRWVANYDGPGDPDGEAFRGNEAEAFHRDQQARARRMK